MKDFDQIYSKKEEDENSQDLQKKQIILLRITMTKESAIKYLKLLHKLEKKYTQNLFTTDLKALAKKLRKEFITAYNK